MHLAGDTGPAIGCPRRAGLARSMYHLRSVGLDETMLREIPLNKIYIYTGIVLKRHICRGAHSQFPKDNAE